MANIDKSLEQNAADDTVSAPVPAGSTRDLLPSLYWELRELARRRLRHESLDCSLEATSLVHEVYVKLSGNPSQQWQNRRHFFAAASEAMRRVLVDRARHRQRVKRGGEFSRQAMVDVAGNDPAEGLPDLLSVHEALAKLEGFHPRAAELIKLRFFAGFTNQEAAAALEVSPRTANQLWAYARAWMLAEIEG